MLVTLMVLIIVLRTFLLQHGLSYAPTDELVNLQGICINRSTNIIADYNIVTKLLSDAISHGIHRIVIKLD